MNRLIEDLQLMRRALEIIDKTELAIDAGAHLDLAIARSEVVLGDPGPQKRE